MALSKPPKAFWPLTVTAGVNDYIDFTINGGSEMSARIAAGVYLSCAALLAACETALEAETVFPVIAVGQYEACAMSMDGGETWGDITSIPAGTYSAVARDGWDVIAVGASVCATSTDGGVTWTARTIPAGTYVDLARDGLNVVAVGTDLCATSTDGGVTWTSRSIPSGGYTSVARDGLNVIALGTNRAATSDDGGETWTSRTFSGDGYDLAMVGLDAVAVGGSNFAYVSTDGGATWSTKTIAVSGAYHGVSRDGLNVVAVGQNVAATSTDGGNTWTVRSFLTGLFLGVAREGLHVTAVGTNVAATSDDGGVTWTSRTIPAGSYKDVALAPSGTVVSWSSSTGATGRVTLSSAVASTLNFSSGAHASTSARDILGFGAVDTASGSTHAAANQHQNGWYPERVVTFDSREEYERMAAGTVAHSGKTKIVTFGSARLQRRVSIGWLPEWKTKIAREGAYTNEALERLWREGFARFRWWPDATVEGTYDDWVLDPADLTKFKPDRDDRMQLYSYTLRMWEHVA